MNAIEETPAKTSRFGRAGKFSLAGAVAAAALGIGAVVALPALTASPAYAVENGDGGKVNIRINDIEDADGLQETLTEHGIKSAVDFTPEGKVCDPDRIKETDEGGPDEVELGNDDDGEYLSIVVDADAFPLDGDQTLVIELSKSALSVNLDEDKGDYEFQALSFSVVSAVGEVGECELIDAEDLPDAGGNGSSTRVDEDDDGTKGHDEKDDDGSKGKN